MPAKRKTRSKTGKRTTIEPHKGDRRYVRRNKKGQFKTEVNVGRSLAADRRRKSKRKVKPGQGDRGDTAGGVMQAVKRALDLTDNCEATPRLRPLLFALCPLTSDLWPLTSDL